MGKGLSCGYGVQDQVPARVRWCMSGCAAQLLFLAVERVDRTPDRRIGSRMSVAGYAVRVEQGPSPTVSGTATGVSGCPQPHSWSSQADPLALTSQRRPREAADHRLPFHYCDTAQQRRGGRFGNSPGRLVGRRPPLSVRLPGLNGAMVITASRCMAWPRCHLAQCPTGPPGQASWKNLACGDLDSARRQLGRGIARPSALCDVRGYEGRGR